MDFEVTTGAARESAARRRATVLALAANLAISVPLWWFSGHLNMSVAAFDRWVVVTTVALGTTLLVGATLQRNDDRATLGDGVLRGILCLIVLYVFWGGHAFAVAAD